MDIFPTGLSVTHTNLPGDSQRKLSQRVYEKLTLTFELLQSGAHRMFYLNRMEQATMMRATLTLMATRIKVPRVKSSQPTSFHATRGLMRRHK